MDGTSPRAATLQRIKDALEGRGVVLIESNVGVGVMVKHTNDKQA